jgi:hypothetical protein
VSVRVVNMDASGGRSGVSVTDDEYGIGPFVNN